MSLLSTVTSINRIPSILKVSGDETLTRPFNIIKLNALSADLTFTLPTLTPSNIQQFALFGNMLIERVDDFTNINNLCKVVAEIPTDLNELNNEIILDIETSVFVFADLDTGKWQSTNQFSDKRIQTIMTRSTSSYVPNYSLPENYIEINNTAHAFETINILQSGNGWIYDRSTGNDKFASRAYKVSWDFTNTQDLDTSPANQDGQFIIMIDKTGAIIVENVNDQPILSDYNFGNRNSNTELQIGAFARDAGVVVSLAAGGGEIVNTGIRINTLIDALGPINKSLSIEFNGANLKLNFLKGDALVRATGYLSVIGGLSPDKESLLNDIPLVTIITVTRDNILQSISNDVNVLQIEDPNNFGTLITLSNNRAKNNFYKASGPEQFVVEFLGREQYLTTQAAIDSLESPEYSSIVNFLVGVQKIAVLKNETNLTLNAQIANTDRINLK